jgi:putative PIN family toxin of toxin-antitoxin system
MIWVVVDTNVLVSALLRGGKPRKLLVRLLEDHSVVVSPQMLAELVDVLSRTKFRLMRRSQIDRFVSVLVEESVILTVKFHVEVIRQDPDDDIVLATAYDGNAQYIVTGDKHLLALAQFEGIRIVTVNEMLGILGKE